MERLPNLRRVDGSSAASGGVLKEVSGVVGTGFDNAEAMAWLDSSLEYTCGENLTRLRDLLEAVRVEILFEMEAAGSEP